MACNQLLIETQKKNSGSFLRFGVNLTAALGDDTAATIAITDVSGSVDLEITNALINTNPFTDDDGSPIEIGKGFHYDAAKGVHGEDTFLTFTITTAAGYTMVIVITLLIRDEGTISNAGTIIPLYTLKRALGIPLDWYTDDAELIRMLDIAEADIEAKLWATFSPRTRIVYSHNFPHHYKTIWLPHGPVTSVTTIEYYDINNDLQTLDPLEYIFAPQPITPSITLLNGKGWPTTYDRPDAVRLTYEAGYVTLPPQVSSAVIVYVTWLRDIQSGGCMATTGVPDAVWALTSTLDLMDIRTISPIGRPSEVRLGRNVNIVSFI